MQILPDILLYRKKYFYEVRDSFMPQNCNAFMLWIHSSEVKTVIHFNYTFFKNYSPGWSAPAI